MYVYGVINIRYEHLHTIDILGRFIYLKTVQCCDKTSEINLAAVKVGSAAL